MLADAVDVAKHIVVPESDYSPAVGAESVSTGHIEFSLFRFAMLRAVNFHDQTMRQTCEVDNKTGNVSLPAKPEPHKPMSPNGIPKLQLGFGQLTSH